MQSCTMDGILHHAIIQCMLSHRTSPAISIHQQATLIYSRAMFFALPLIRNVVCAVIAYFGRGFQGVTTVLLVSR